MDTILQMIPRMQTWLGCCSQYARMCQWLRNQLHHRSSFLFFFTDKSKLLFLKALQKKNLNMTVCRHCSKLSFDDKSYASVLVVGSIEGLEKTIEDLESRIMPCVSALCPRCEKISVLSNGTTESLLCTVFMWQRLREWIDTSYDEKHARIPPHSGV